MIVVFSLLVFKDGFWPSILHQEIIISLLVILLSNTLEQLIRRYDQMRNPKIRLEFNWEFKMHLVRIAVILLVVFFANWLGLIIWLALALSYVEIYPMRALRFFGGDHTLETGNENRSRD